MGPKHHGLAFPQNNFERFKRTGFKRLRTETHLTLESSLNLIKLT